MPVVRWDPIAALLARPWQAWRRLLARTPLRVRLIAAVLLLVTVSLTLISVAGIAVLRGSLVGRLDDQLGRVTAMTLHGLAEGRVLGPPTESRVRPPSPYLVALLDQNVPYGELMNVLNALEGRTA